VLIDVSLEALSSVIDKRMAEMIVSVREGRARVIPGYDGVYGRLDVTEGGSGAKIVPERVQQLNLTDFLG